MKQMSNQAVFIECADKRLRLVEVSYLFVIWIFDFVFCLMDS